MRTLNSLVLLAALNSPLLLEAQNLGEIRGKIIAPDGTEQIGASVYIDRDGALFGSVTDLDGRFILKPLEPGVYSVNISYVGTKPITVQGVEVIADRITFLPDQRMMASAGLDSIPEFVYYRRPLIEQNDPGRMTLLAEEIAKVPTAKNPIGLMSSQFAGVTAAANGEGLYFRGSRTENMASYIDGVKLSGAVPRIPPSAISSISVYTGGLPARYGDVTGGVIVIETKTYAEMYQYAQRKAAQAVRERELAD